MVYKWVEGSRLGGNPQAVGEELERIRKRDGSLIQDSVWRAAKSKDSVLHRYFTWDVKKAAEKCWREEAGELIRHVAVVIRDQDERPLMIRSFVKTEGVGYDSTIRAMGQSESRALIFKRAVAELEAFKEKYRRFAEFSEVFSAISKLKVKTAKKATSVPVELVAYRPTDHQRPSV